MLKFIIPARPMKGYAFISIFLKYKVLCGVELTHLKLIVYLKYVATTILNVINLTIDIRGLTFLCNPVSLL